MRGTRAQAERALARKVGKETRQPLGVGIGDNSITFDFESQEGLNRFIETYFQQKEEETEIVVTIVAL